MNENKSLPYKPKTVSELPFFFYLTLSLTFLGIWSIFNSPKLQSPARMVPFILLMVIHIGLYWMAILITRKKPFVPLYLIGQGFLALVIVLLAENTALPFGLYMGLIGLTVGIYNLSRLSIGLIGFFLVLSLVSFSRASGWVDSIWWLIGFIPLMAFVVIYVFLYNRQAEAREKAQTLAADLEQANHQLGEYAERVEALTLANERQRMARELHDTLSQGLAGLILQLEAVDAHLDSNRTGRARSIVQQAMAQARLTLTDARHAIDDLRQAPVDLTESVKQAAQRFTQATGIPCPVQVEILEPVPSALNEPAQRAIAEALSNIARHAQATQVSVRLAGNRADGLDITVADDGVGFDPYAAIEQQPGHYGLLGIRERARLAGGSLEIQSQPDHGTKLHLHLPYPTEDLADLGIQRSAV